MTRRQRLARTLAILSGALAVVGIVAALFALPIGLALALLAAAFVLGVATIFVDEFDEPVSLAERLAPFAGGTSRLRAGDRVVVLEGATYCGGAVPVRDDLSGRTATVIATADEEGDCLVRFDRLAEYPHGYYVHESGLRRLRA